MAKYKDSLLNITYLGTLENITFQRRLSTKYLKKRQKRPSKWSSKQTEHRNKVGYSIKQLSLLSQDELDVFREKARKMLTTKAGLRVRMLKNPIFFNFTFTEHFNNSNLTVFEYDSYKKIEFENSYGYFWNFGNTALLEISPFWVCNEPGNYTYAFYHWEVYDYDSSISIIDENGNGLEIYTDFWGSSTLYYIRDWKRVGSEDIGGDIYPDNYYFFVTIRNDYTAYGKVWVEVEDLGILEASFNTNYPIKNIKYIRFWFKSGTPNHMKAIDKIVKDNRRWY